MSTKYRYGHRPDRRRRTRVFIVITISSLIVALVGGLIYYDNYRNRSKEVSGYERTIIQADDENTNKLSVNEPTFNMELPSDWKEVNRTKNKTENSITWQATKKGVDNRYLKIYVDTIPATKSINRLLPVSAVGDSLNTGDISENCASFTKTGTFNTDESVKLEDTLAKYQSIDFLCNLPNVIDNQIGSGSTEGINVVTVKGPSGVPHKYFFLFTDHNIQPDYTIFYGAIKSFKAK